MNKTFHFWHVLVRGLKPGVHYAYRVDGPLDSAGHRFNKNKVLIDPYHQAVQRLVAFPVVAGGVNDN